MNVRFRGKKKKSQICSQGLTSSTQLNSKSFNVVDWTRTTAKCTTMINARTKRAKILFFIVRYSNVRRLCRRSRLPNFCRNGRLHYVTAMFVIFHFLFRRSFQNHLVDIDYSCFTVSCNGYHYCAPCDQGDQA